MSTSLVQLIFASHGNDRGSSLEKANSSRPRSASDAARASTHSAQDAELIRDVRSGNLAAFESLFAQYWTPLWRFARTETASGDAAEDIVQSVFTRLWMLHASWDPQGSIQAYLFRAVRNAFTDQRKHEHVMRGYEASEALNQQPSVGTIETQVELNDQLVRLNKALAQLPPARRQAVILRYENALSYAEIGAILGFSSQAVEKQIARTIEALRASVTE